MTDLEALKEGMCNSIYEKEPLARAIISYLDKTNPKAHSEIVDIFDKIVETKFNQYIHDYKENEEDDL